jgi:hypothetical protein
LGLYRYDDRDRHSRYPSSSASKHHSSTREPRDYEVSGSAKYEEDYNKYPQDKYEGSSSKHDSHHHPSSSGRYDYNSKSSSSRSNYDRSSHRDRGPPQPSSGLLPASPAGHRERERERSDRDRDRDRDRERDRDSKPYFDQVGPVSSGGSRRPFEYEAPALLALPATDIGSVVPLLELNIPPPSRSHDYHNDSRPLPPPDHSEKLDVTKSLSESARGRKEEVVSHHPSEKAAVENAATEVKKEAKEHRRRKSSEDKKLKKKKHKKEKKKDKDEKKDKKRKKSKDGEGPGETLAGLLIDPASLETDIKTELLTNTTEISLDSKTALETKLTAPCDSTVKSPERTGWNKGSSVGGLDPQGSLNAHNESVVPAGIVLGELHVNPYISDRGVAMPDLTKQPVPTGREGSGSGSDEKTSRGENNCLICFCCHLPILRLLIVIIMLPEIKSNNSNILLKANFINYCGFRCP